VDNPIQNVNLTPGNHLLSMPVSGMDDGVYLMRITLDRQEYTELVVIRH
jgi:hypothetical protein